MSKFTAEQLESKNKAELRELCRENGIGYNGMNNEGMRAALLTVPGAEQPATVEVQNPQPLVDAGVLQEGSSQLEAPAPQPVELPPVMQPPVTPAAPVRKIQAGRPERNGVKRPSEGTICAQIWAWCDREHDTNGKVSAKDLRAALSTLDNTTCTVQFYRWRKFNGIQGRA